MKLARSILCVLAAAFTVYGIFVVRALGSEKVSSFAFIVWAIILAVVAVTLPFFQNLPKKTALIVSCIMAAAVASLALFLTEAITNSLYQPAGRAEYVIIIADSLDGSDPGEEYAGRLDYAIDYMEKYAPDIPVIITGAKYEGEGVSRAQAGKEYLAGRGIEESRIVLEEEGRTTKEQMENCLEVLKSIGGGPDSSIVAVTSKYHMYRTRLISDTAGYTNITCGGSDGIVWLWPQRYFSEYGSYMSEFFRNQYRHTGNSFSRLFGGSNK